jgi:hypothetical protein
MKMSCQCVSLCSHPFRRFRSAITCSTSRYRQSNQIRSSFLLQLCCHPSFRHHRWPFRQTYRFQHRLSPLPHRISASCRFCKRQYSSIYLYHRCSSLGRLSDSLTGLAFLKRPRIIMDNHMRIALVVEVIIGTYIHASSFSE